MTRWLTLALLLAACEKDDPAGTPDAAPAADAPQAPDAAAACPDGGTFPPIDESACTHLATDYEPRVNMSMDDTWAPCISDDDQYHPFDTNISTVARVAAFETIADLLWESATPPTAQAFLDARLVYTQDQGLESRVARREDLHYPAPPMACADLTPAELTTYADRCVGPATLQPLLNDAFAQGALGEDPAGNAARVEATLLWFLYVSSYKEANTCASVVNDCDSGYAYYTGGEPRAGGLGLSRYLGALSQNTHDRAFDGVLAVRCWRDLDNPTGAATDLAMRDQAIRQLDTALLRGLALIVRDRALALDASCGEANRVAWVFLRVLGQVLDREAEARDPAAAAVLRGELAKVDPASVDVALLVTALDGVFACP